MIKQTKYYYNYILILIGLGIVSWIIWARFLRTRVPKDIPFELTEYWFFILMYICMIYFYMVYKLIRPGKPNENITIIVEILFTPLATLDDHIKNNKHIKPTYLKFVDKIIAFLSTYEDESEQSRVIRIIYLLCYIIPRLILVTILCLDTFYFHKLAWIYKIILLGVIPLFLRYIKYSISYIKDQFIADLESKYSEISLHDKNWSDIDWEHDSKTMKYHDTEVSVKEYIRILLEIEQIKGPKIEYNSTPLLYESQYIEYSKDKYNDEKIKFTAEDYVNLDSDFYRLIPIILNLSNFLKNYSKVDYHSFIIKLFYIKYIKIVIFSLYGICWAYIIYRSYHMIPYPFMDTLCKLMTTLPGLEEPFSGDLLIYWESI